MARSHSARNPLATHIARLVEAKLKIFRERTLPLVRRYESLGVAVQQLVVARRR